MPSRCRWSSPRAEAATGALGRTLQDQPVRWRPVGSAPESLARRVWRHVPDGPRRWVQSVRHPAPADRQWMRTVMNKDAADYLRALPPEQHEAVEVSGSDRAGLPWKSYASLQYPEFDLCGDQLPDRAYDVVICEQVLEHVPDLTKAVANLRKLCRPGGRILVSTPFLVKIHGHPDDYWRLTSSGVRVLLEGAGLRIESIKTWGNRQCARRNLRKWTPYRPWHSLKNDPDVPMVVWA